MGFKLQYTFTWVFFVAGIILSAIQVQSDALELSRRDMAFVAIGQALCLGVLPFLPKITKPPENSRQGQD